MAKEVKNITVRIFHPGQKRATNYRHRAEPGRCFTKKGIEAIVTMYKTSLSRNYPQTAFRLVELEGGDGLTGGIAIAFRGTALAEPQLGVLTAA